MVALRLRLRQALVVSVPIVRLRDSGDSADYPSDFENDPVVCAAELRASVEVGAAPVYGRAAPAARLR